MVGLGMRWVERLGLIMLNMTSRWFLEVGCTLDP
jgi:hypothetical protein